MSVELPFCTYDLSEFLSYTPGGSTDWIRHCDCIAMNLQMLGMAMVKDPRNNEEYKGLLCDGEAALCSSKNVGSHEQICPTSQLGLWTGRMGLFGKTMLDTATTVAEMAALGWGLGSSEFTDKMNMAQHRFVTSAFDLKDHGKEGTVLEAPHIDMNLLTLYGTTSSSCLQGINIWLSNGEKVSIRIPEGCCAVVPGKQMEWLTGGVCLACKHEVVVTTEAAQWLGELKWMEDYPIEAAEVYSMGPPPIHSHWRISSEFYAHVAPEVRMMPLGHFSIKELASKTEEYKDVSGEDFLKDFAIPTPSPSRSRSKSFTWLI